jgi:predicted Zn-dependent peptidase
VEGAFAGWANRAPETGSASQSPAAIPAPAQPSAPLALVDRPGAAQSELRVGQVAVPRLTPDYYALLVLNTVLGGQFVSRLNMNLREDKGYTYGAHSEFSGDILPGSFQVSTAVHTEATAPALRECLREIERIRDGVEEHELALAKSALSQSMLRNYEQLRARLALVDNSSRYGRPDDYPTRRLAWLERATLAELRELARRRVHPDRLAMLVVGDAAVIEASLAEIAPVVRLDLDGRRIR